MSGTVSTQDQAFVTDDGQMNVTEIESGLLAESRSANLATAELGRWFASQHGFLQGALNVVGAQTGASVPQTPGTANAAIIQTLTGLNGAAFDSAYLPAEINGHAMNLASHQTEAASGANPLLKQVAIAETPVVQNHLYQAQLLNQQELGGAAPTVSLTSSFQAAPPLAAEGALNAADRNFIASATYASLTAIQEGQLAQASAAAPSVQAYGNWNITNDGPLAADVAALAQAGGASVPNTLAPAFAAQVSALSSLHGSAFDLQYAVDGIGNYQAVLQVLNTEAATGSDPALVALAKAAIPTATALLGQAVIEFGAAVTGLSDAAAAPTTGAGSVLSAIGGHAAAGTATIAFESSAATAPAVPSGSVGIFIANQAQGIVPAGYSDVIDAAAAPATITGAAGGSEIVLGGASGLSFFAGSGASGTVALTGGNNVVVGPATGAGNWSVTGQGGNNTIFTGSGSDTVAAGSGSNAIGLGSGRNLVLSSGSDTVSGSTGRDTVIGQGGTQKIVIGTQGLTFVGGSGSASILAAAGSATIFGGAGGNVALFGNAQNNVLVAGTGNETLQGGSATGSERLFGGSGSATLVGGTGGNYFGAGTGNNVMVGGNGPDLFQFVNGQSGGVDVIDNFAAASDKISLSGYGGSAVQQAVSTAAESGGSTVITLSDQTRIFLTGVSSVNTSNFA